MQKQRIKKVAILVLRWGIAVFGILYVVEQMSWHDRVLALVPGTAMPQYLTMANDASTETALAFTVMYNGKTLTLDRSDVVNEPDKSKMYVAESGRRQCLVGLDLSADLTQVRRLLLADSPTGPAAHWAMPADVGGYQLNIPHPRLQIGVIHMVRQANTDYLLAGLAVFPITILITSLRWHELLKAVDIRLTLSRTFVLNMVGIFYNTFMPGSTGGDVLKAYYVAKQTHHRTRAVMSVLVDRAVGLVALIILGGVMASLQTQIPKCRQVAIGSAGILLVLGLGMILFYVPVLRKFSGLEWLINRLPMQGQVHKAIETMHIYARRPWLGLAALVCSFPVHMIVIISAMLCGTAFGLPIRPLYYWMVVPVIVLAGSIPISPQGAGVMEYFGIKLLEPQGVAVAQVFALTMSIRLVQMFWNLTGGFFVIRGGFHKPTEVEQKQVELEDEDERPAPGVQAG